MSSPQYPYPPQPPQAPQGAGLKTALAGGAIAASLAFNAFLLYQVNDIRKEEAHRNEVVQNEIDTLKENSTVMTAAQKKHMEELKEDLDTSKKQLSQQANQAASQAKKEALNYTEEQSKRLEAENQQTKQAVAQTNSALGEVKQKADTANARISDVNSDVNGVKTDLAGTKSELDKTKSELKKVSGDLGITSGYVATNSKEIEDLRRRGERNIIEFSVKKQKNMQKVGDISVRLEKSDLKKNRFTIVVLADDKTVEKKDKTVNEPLQFYVSKSLYEVVVNSVGKDQISGYLSTPKYQTR